MKYIYSILIVLSLAVEARAQVFPPDFLCVRNDSLFWELPTNTCGAFNSYEIFFSPNPNGPYTLLSSINNDAETNYFHSNPLGETFYFYMQTNANCPGEQVLHSDTLNNESPTPSPISAVTVTGNQVIVDWLSSTSPEVTNYIIYRTSPNGTLPVDTVDADANTYIDLASNPGNKVESYFILAMDACGNTSIFDLPHFTIFIESAYTPCGRIIDLKWNRYQNWLNGIDKQELWMSTNNSSFSLQEELSVSDSTYIFTETNDGDTYCFYIKATERISGIESFSNVNCLNVDFVEPVRSLFLKNASVNDANQVELTWQWNDDAEVASVAFMERAEGDNFSTIDSYTPASSIDSEITQIVNGADPTSNKHFYQLKSIDDCDSTNLSNEVLTVHLLGVAQANQTNLLNWTPFERADGNIDSYEIYRKVGGISSYIETVDGMTTTFTDPIDISNPGEANVCYYIIANATVTDPDGFEIAIASQSNTFCVVQLSDILVPNAFIPDGINKEFKPRIVFVEEAIGYDLQIFDRWGKKIFESTAPDQGWTGRKGFSYYPSGVYIYLIRLEQANGRRVEKRGSVALIR
ncbi:MAG: gliding motility-associated-like protein [Saprospiraceae bacterium]